MIDFDDPVKQKKKEYKLIKSETPLSNYDMLMELEAFAVARSIPADLIANKLKEYCQ